MKPVLFDEQIDLPPLPFDRRVLAAARQLKAMGLVWHPHVGCFVWDHKGIIPVPSPFPLNVHFIVSLPRFVAILGDLEEIHSQLVWIPTWHQGEMLCRQMGLSIDGLAENESGMTTSGDELLALYGRIAGALTRQGRKRDRGIDR